MDADHEDRQAVEGHGWALGGGWCRHRLGEDVINRPIHLFNVAMPVGVEAVDRPLGRRDDSVVGGGGSDVVLERPLCGVRAMQRHKEP